MPHEKIFAIKGIGESVGKKIIEILETGQLNQLKEYLSNTPEGVLEIMNIKGLGPKKINLLLFLSPISECSDTRVLLNSTYVLLIFFKWEITQNLLMESHTL